MAEENATDIFIKFVLNGSPLDGESSTDLGKPSGRNDLLTGFKAGSMFELQSFSFSVGIEDDDEETKTRKKNEKAAKRGDPPPKVKKGTGNTMEVQLPRPLGGFPGWRRGGRDKPYPAEVQPVTLVRAIDKASTSLMTHCVKCTSFDYIALVKRKPAGGAAAGQGFLRMDFVGSLITEVAWTNEDPIKETCRFISRAITVRYKPQLPDGTLGAPRVGFWSMLPWETEAPLR
jgi:type VI protein secretion system component Hcp